MTQPIEQALEAELAEKNDIKAAESTYTSFLTMLKWGTIISIAVAALVILIIA
ncbi:MAG: aa3-type cytochrome c oxidase subunit IV [Sphingorhabdus sp.]